MGSLPTEGTRGLPEKKGWVAQDLVWLLYVVRTGNGRVVRKGILSRRIGVEVFRTFQRSYFLFSRADNRYTCVKSIHGYSKGYHLVLHFGRGLSGLFY